VRAAAPADVARVTRCISNGRTADLAKFILHAKSKLAAFDAGMRLHGALAARRDKLRVHRAQERHFHRLTQRLAWGFTTVKSVWQNKGLPHKSFTPADRPKLSIIGFGDSSTGHGSPLRRKYGTGPSRAFERFVHCNYRSVCFLRVDEFRTSKVCTSCWECDKTNLVLAGKRSHKIQACERHGEEALVVDRDASASVAIMAVLLGMLFEQQIGGWNDGWRDRAVSIREKTPTPAAG
jgi:hypothetical protein